MESCVGGTEEGRRARKWRSWGPQVPQASLEASPGGLGLARSPPTTCSFISGQRALSRGPHALPSTTGQSLRAPRQGLRNGPEAATETSAVSSPRPGLNCQCGLGRGLLWARVQGGARGTHAGATKQPALSVPGPPGSQPSRSGQLGWEGRQGCPGFRSATDLFPQFIRLPPTPPGSAAPTSRGREGHT